MVHSQQILFSVARFVWSGRNRTRYPARLANDRSRVPRLSRWPEREQVCPDFDYVEEPEEEGAEGTASTSARADREQHFFAQRIFEFPEIERRLTFVAQ